MQQLHLLWAKFHCVLKNSAEDAVDLWYGLVYKDTNESGSDRLKPGPQHDTASCDI